MLYSDYSPVSTQLKDMAERLPPGVYDPENMRPAYIPNGLETNGVHYSDMNGERHSRSDSVSSSILAFPMGVDSVSNNGTGSLSQFLRETTGASGRDDQPVIRLPNGSVGVLANSSCVSESSEGKESMPLQDLENGTRPRSPALSVSSHQVEAEWIEQYEPGVYITLVALRDGTRDLKRVRFR